MIGASTADDDRGPGGDGADDLALARDRILAAAHLDAAAVRAALTDLHDLWMAARIRRVVEVLATPAPTGGLGPGLAVVATGAWARGELLPGVAPTVTVLHDRRDADAARVARLLDPRQRVLDLGCGSVGTAATAALSDENADVALTALRLLAGDDALVARLESWLRRARTAEAGRRRAGELLAASGVREIAHRTCPRLDRRSGLDDLALLDLLVASDLVAPTPVTRQARRTLLDLRTEMRRAGWRHVALPLVDPTPAPGTRPDPPGGARAGRAPAPPGPSAARALRAGPGHPDADADAVAARLGLDGAAGLARELAEAGLDLALALAGARPRATAAARRRPGAPSTPAGPSATRSGLPEPRGAVGALRAAVEAARLDAPLAPEVLDSLGAHPPRFRTPWPVSVREAFFDLLAGGPGLVLVVAQLDRAGVWTSLLPEWATVRALLPPDAAQEWTVDRHLLEACVRCGPGRADAPRRDPLRLAALLHGIGHGRGGDHCVVGEALVRRIGRRMALPAPDVDLVARAVRHHHLLARVATRDDLDDPGTARTVVDTVEGDVTLLALLHGLTRADALATAPSAWTPWRAALVGELVDRCRTLLAADGDPVSTGGGRRRW